MNTATANQIEAVKPLQVSDRKRVTSMLDPFTEPLLEMDDATKSLKVMVAWLKTQGVEAKVSNLSAFLISRRRRRAHQELLNIEKDAFESYTEWANENPNATLEAVIERLKMLALSLSMTKEAAPEVLRLADRLAWTVTRYVNDQSRAEYRKHKLIMEQEKHAEWVKCERTRAFELCLDEAKKYPAVADMYRAAFNALEKCQKENGE
jgi:hypothetical protein